MLKNNFSIVISAPSGAGKTTIIKELIKENADIAFVISTTSRNKRKDELEGKSYYFIDENNFKIKITNDDFIEWSLVHENYYGVEKKEFDRIMNLGTIPIFDVDIQGAKKLKKNIKNAVFIFIIPPSIYELKERLIKRGANSEDDIYIRIKNAIIELKESINYDYIVINNNINDAVDDIKAIIKAEKCRIKNYGLYRKRKSHNV